MSAPGCNSPASGCVSGVRCRSISGNVPADDDDLVLEPARGPVWAPVSVWACSTISAGIVRKVSEPSRGSSSHAMRRCDSFGCRCRALCQQAREALADKPEPGNGPRPEPYDPIPLGGEIDIAGRAPCRGDEFACLLQCALGRPTRSSAAARTTLALARRIASTSMSSLSGGGVAGKENVDADHLGAGGVDSLHQPRQQRTIDRLANLVVLQCVIGDADDGHMRDAGSAAGRTDTRCAASPITCSKRSRPGA